MICQVCGTNNRVKVRGGEGLCGGCSLWSGVAIAGAIARQASTNIAQCAIAFAKIRAVLVSTERGHNGRLLEVRRNA